MTWLDNIRKLASSIALAAIGTAPFYSVVQVLLWPSNAIVGSYSPISKKRLPTRATITLASTF
jgi:hypothetical protein